MPPQVKLQEYVCYLRICLRLPMGGGDSVRETPSFSVQAISPENAADLALQIADPIGDDRAQWARAYVVAPDFSVSTWGVFLGEDADGTGWGSLRAA